MQILLINHYAGSEKMGMEFRPYYLAREWVKNGHVVHILAASHAHVRTKQPKVLHDFHTSVIDGIFYHWIKTPRYSGNGLSRFLNMLTFVLKLYSEAAIIALRFAPDVVIASSTYPLDNYPARKISRLSGACYFYEVHDLWPLSPMELGGMGKGHPFIRIMQAAENYAYKHVDGVISMLPKTIEHMVEHGLDPAKWKYVPNGIVIEEDSSNQKLPTELQTLIDNLKQKEFLLIAYTGSMGLANALDNLIDAASLLRDEKIAYLIVGNGPEKERLKTRIQDEKLSGVYILDAISKQSVAVFLEQMDILYIGLQRQSLFRFGISPNKMLDYMQASKPIIQAIDAGNNMVKEAGCGLSVEPENPEALAMTIKELQNNSSEVLESMGAKGKAYVLQNHNYSELAQKMTGIFENCLIKRKPQFPALDKTP